VKARLKLAGSGIAAALLAATAASAQVAAPGIASDGAPVAPEAAGLAKTFQDELRLIGSGATVEGCSTVVTEKAASPGGPWSHGGVCTIRAEGKPVRVMMCDSDGVGGFALATSFTATEDGVRRFVLSACPRG
jgi:hypothetical protein